MPKAKAKGKKPGRYTPPFSNDQKKAVVKAYKAGKTLDELAAQYKCSTSKIRKVLLNAKVSMRGRGPQAAPKKAKAKKVSKPKAVKPKAKAVKKIGKDQAVRDAANKARRDAENKARREQRAAKKSGLAAALAAVAANN